MAVIDPSLPIGTIVATFLASGGVLTVVAFVGRGVFTQWLGKSLEAYKIGLKAAADRELEGLRADLQRVASERQIVFGRLHERRADVIADVYAKLEDLHAALRQWNMLKDVGGTGTAAFKERAEKALRELDRAYYPRAIWLDRAICNQLNELLDGAGGFRMLFQLLVGEDTGAELSINGKTVDLRQFANEVNQAAAGARGALDASFRKTLGAEAE
jgi:hypothetical protein